MGDIPDAMGSAVEGGLLARAAEPRRGARTVHASAGHTQESDCLNCGTPLIGPHCHGCGQHAHVHRTMGAFLHDLLHGALHFEGKTWHTLPMLVRWPGQLTRRYIDGERARFVSPMALFLFCIFLMFAVFQIAGISPPATVGIPAEVQETMSRQLDTARDRRETVAAQLAELAPDDPARADLQRRILQLDGTIRQLEVAQPVLDQGSGFPSLKTGWAPLDHGIEKANKNPGLMLYKLQSNSYKFSWLLIPLSIPFVALLFLWRGSFGLYDHAVFVTYSLSFMSLLFIGLTLLGFAGVSMGLLAAAAIVIPLWHLSTQLRHTYGLTRASAVWRTVVLAIFINMILVLFVVLLLLMGLMG